MYTEENSNVIQFVHTVLSCTWKLSYTWKRISMKGIQLIFNYVKLWIFNESQIFFYEFHETLLETKYLNLQRYVLSFAFNYIAYDLRFIFVLIKCNWNIDRSTRWAIGEKSYCGRYHDINRIKLCRNSHKVDCIYFKNYIFVFSNPNMDWRLRLSKAKR